MHKGEGNSLVALNFLRMLTVSAYKTALTQGDFCRHTKDYFIFGLWPNTLASEYGAMISFIHFSKVSECCPQKDYWSLKFQLWHAKPFIHPSPPAASVATVTTPLISQIE